MDNMEGRRALFARAHEEVLVGPRWATSYCVPSARDVCAAVEAIVRTRKQQEAASSVAEPLAGGVVQDADSMLAAFEPVTCVWSVTAHANFPDKARERARELLLLGAALARSGRAALPLEIWTDVVMPRVIERRSLPGGVGEAGKRLPIDFLQ